MARDDLHFRLRIPEALKAQVEAAAEENKRSMTAEIIARLEDSFSEQSSGVVNVDRIVDALESRFGSLGLPRKK